LAARTIPRSPHLVEGGKNNCIGGSLCRGKTVFIRDAAKHAACEIDSGRPFLFTPARATLLSKE
jgi:hypothetical protein